METGGWLGWPAYDDDVGCTSFFAEASELVHQFYRGNGAMGWSEPVFAAMGNEVERLRTFMSRSQRARLDDLINELSDQWKIIREVSR